MVKDKIFFTDCELLFMNLLSEIGQINRKTDNRQLDYVQYMKIYSMAVDTKQLILAIFATINIDAGYQ